MPDNWSDLTELNRCVVESLGHDDCLTSKALQEAIAESRKHIEAAFRDSISAEQLGRIKVKVKLAG